MPEDYHCSSCQLEFVVGWFHYHDFSRGFAAMTYLVCACCGTMHAVEHAVTSVPESLARPFWRRIFGANERRTQLQVADLAPGQLADRLLTQPGPIFGNEVTEAPYKIQFKDWIECEASVLFRPVRKIGEYPRLEAAGDRLDLTKVRCRHCKTVGSLTSGWPCFKGEWGEGESDGCPSCGEVLREPVSSWMT